MRSTSTLQLETVTTDEAMILNDVLSLNDEAIILNDVLSLNDLHDSCHES